MTVWKVLIADNDEHTGVALRNMLTAAGHKAYWVIDGISAMEKVSDFVPDLVILDMNISELDVFETCETIKDMPELSHTVLIAQGKRPSKEIYDDTKRAGFDFFLTKPITLEMLELFLGGQSANRIETQIAQPATGDGLVAKSDTRTKYGFDG